jgi:HD-GYP domain-containing protein (c-di-GMP phosphodiesterase class II)
MSLRARAGAREKAVGTPRIDSLFAQRLDRAVFGIYFLAAVVPVLVLAAVVQLAVLPARPESAAAWTAGVFGLGVLSLLFYAALRRVVRGTLARMDSDNRRLARLLDLSRSLSAESHLEIVADRVTGCAQALTGADAALCVLAARADKELALREATGEAARRLAAEHGEALVALARDALEAGRVLQSAGPPAAAAAPFAQPGGGRGALVVAGAHLEPEALAALETLAGVASVALHNAELRDSQRNFFAHVTDLLVTALDAHVEGRGGHGSRVARLANLLGRELGLSDERLAHLHFAALLHDIGMLRIDRALHLTPAACEPHALLGARLLGRIRLWEPVAPLVLHHHERWDGTGYPEGLAGEAIPLESRVLAVADAADAMARSESRRVGLAPDAVRAELTRCRGTQFDPRVVDAFLALAERGDLPPA